MMKDGHALPLGTLLTVRAAERNQILAYGAALAHERATHRAVEVLGEVHGRCRRRLDTMHWADAERLQDALREAERVATEEHEQAAAALSGLVSPFTVINELLSAAAGT